MLKKKVSYTVLMAIFATSSLFPLNLVAAEEEYDESRQQAGQTNQRIPLEDVQRFSNAISEIKKYPFNNEITLF